MKDIDRIASRSEVEQFLQDTEFDGYQEVALPHGLSVPGKNKTKMLDVIFPSDLGGKTVLDVGCCYGFYMHEAIQRGAGAVTGIEMNASRAKIARQAAVLRGESVTVYEGDLMTAPVPEKADIVIFLSVLHHVPDPIAVVRRLAELSRDEVIIEFCLPEHHMRRKLVNRSLRNKVKEYLNDVRRRFGIGLMGCRTLLSSWAMWNTTACSTSAATCSEIFF